MPPASAGFPALAAALAACFTVAWSTAARAQEQPRTVVPSAGVLILAGGNYLSTPEDVPGGYEGVGYAGDAGGFGWGVAAYGEARIVEHLGLRAWLGIDRSTLSREVTINGVVKVDEKLAIATTRAGLMVEGVVPAPFGRAWVGVGPEFAFGPSVEATNEISAGRQYVPDPRAVEDLIEGNEQSSTLLAFGLGLAFHAGDLVEIPFEIRAAKNLSDETAWTDRVELRGNPLTSYSVVGRSSWEFRMALGAGVRF